MLAVSSLITAGLGSATIRSRIPSKSSLKGWHQRMTVYFFLCDRSTETECLERQLFGTTTLNFEWAGAIVPGVPVFLYNFQTGDIWGPFEAVSTADCYESQAWGRKFPVQIRVAKTAASRKSNLIAANRKEFLTWRRSRPDHVLDDPLANSLLGWMREQGMMF